MSKFDPQALKYNENGLIPAIAQQHDTGEVLMLAWMNAESVAETLRGGRVVYWSRSRQEFWRKGDTSGHHQRLIDLRYDCDRDCLLLLVDQTGPACHTGRRSCFYTAVRADAAQTIETENPFARLRAAGFDVIIRNHAESIFAADFRNEAQELAAALLEMRIPAEELVASGGGEAKLTQRLRNRLYQCDWRKHNFSFEQFVDGVAQVSTSHEIDHVRRAQAGVVALEIEWNNKDPFFDRDLENFQRLHAQSAISLGLIVTRGSSMQAAMTGIIQRCLEKHGVTGEEGLSAFDMKDRTQRQREAVKKAIRSGAPYAEAFAKQFVADKFGKATTHWEKLEERVRRGVGNPCPLVLIGLPVAIIDENAAYSAARTPEL